MDEYIDYNDYLAEIVEKDISYTEYVNEQENNMVYTQYVVEQLKKDISYDDYFSNIDPYREKIKKRKNKVDKLIADL